MLRDLAREEVNIVTLEDPVEYYIPGVSQCQINEKGPVRLRRRPARHSAPGPRHHLRRRDPRRRDREHRHARGHHRPSGALDPAHQRRPLRGRPSARHRRGAVADLRQAARRDIAAACAPHLPALQKEPIIPRATSWPCWGWTTRRTLCSTRARAARTAITPYTGRRAVFEILMIDAPAPPHHRRRERGTSLPTRPAGMASPPCARPPRPGAADGETTAEEAARTISSTIES